MEIFLCFENSISQTALALVLYIIYIYIIYPHMSRHGPLVESGFSPIVQFTTQSDLTPQ